MGLRADCHSCSSGKFVSRLLLSITGGIWVRTVHTTETVSLLGLIVFRLLSKRLIGSVVYNEKIRRFDNSNEKITRGIDEGN
jgi:hypothetical protein